MATNNRRLTNAEYNLIERLMLAKQGQVRKMLAPILLKYYPAEDVIITKEYLIAKGDIPIALAAHMDTVWETSTGHEVFYDSRKNIMVNLRGGGYDDKVGIFMILKILEQGYRPHVIFCTDEESGSLGAEQLIEDFPKCPFNDCRFIIMLDRRGFVDCVFYDCDNPDFVNYIEKFGFKEAYGSFTDICTLCPAWGMAGVNLSVGYQDEHSANERLFVGAMFNTLDKVINILSQSDEDIVWFEFIPDTISLSRWYRSGYRYFTDDDDEEERAKLGDTCDCCNHTIPSGQHVDYIKKDGSWGRFCFNCAKTRVSYCELCGEAFEVGADEVNPEICPHCYEDYFYGSYPREEDGYPYAF